MPFPFIYELVEAQEEAKKIIERAEDGYADAQWELAKRYASDDYTGVATDMDEAVKWAKRAARQGHKEAQEWLKQRYYDLIDWR